MKEVDDFVQDLISLFDMDLLNKIEKEEYGVVVIMKDNSKVRVIVKQIA